jgi:hypothetical protein
LRADEEKNGAVAAIQRLHADGESNGPVEPAHRAKFRAGKRAHEQCHGLGQAAAIEFDVQAGKIGTAIPIYCVHAERTANQTMQRASRELRFAARYAHHQLHRCARRRGLPHATQ